MINVFSWYCNYELVHNWFKICLNIFQWITSRYKGWSSFIMIFCINIGSFGNKEFYKIKVSTFYCKYLKHFTEPKLWFATAIFIKSANSCPWCSQIWTISLLSPAIASLHVSSPSLSPLMSKYLKHFTEPNIAVVWILVALVTYPYKKKKRGCILMIYCWNTSEKCVLLFTK